MIMSFFTQAPEALRTEKTLSLIELIKNGGIGGQLIIGLLFLLLIVALYIYPDDEQVLLFENSNTLLFKRLCGHCSACLLCLHLIPYAIHPRFT